MDLQSAAFVSLRNCPRLAKLSFLRLHGVARHCETRNSSKISLPRFQVDCKSCVSFATTGAIICNNSSKKSGFRVNAWTEPFRGKSGSVSFGGLTHQSVEESKLVSAPFEENKGSLVWVLAPATLIASLIVPQFLIVGAIEDLFKNEVVAEIIVSFATEVIFYAGLSIFLLLTEHVQKPYLQFSSKRWSLITGLRGYLSSAFFAMGLKVFAPVLAVYVTWPVLRLTALVSVAPFLIGCLAQFAFERRLEQNASSCWPLLPIIFEIYRIYQLTRAAGFIERLMYGMRDAPMTPAVFDKSSALVSMVMTFRLLGVICLWSLLTFLVRLFPSRPVAENY